MTEPSPAPTPEPIVYNRRVRFSDCDVQGIVYNPNYLVYWDDAFTDYMDAVGCSWDFMVGRGDDVVLARTEIDYRRSARMGQVVSTAVRVAGIGRSSITFEYLTTDGETGETVVEGRQVQVIVDHETMRPKTVPGYLRTMIARHEGWSDRSGRPRQPHPSTGAGQAGDPPATGCPAPGAGHRS